MQENDDSKKSEMHMLGDFCGFAICPVWWWNFLRALCKRLRSTPRPKQLSRLMLEKDVAMKCTIDGKLELDLKEFHFSMETFEKALMEEIDLAIAEVCIKLRSSFIFLTYYRYLSI